MLRLKHGEAFTAASDNPELVEGAHASSLLIVLDEAKAIPVGVWDAIEGALSTPGETLALATSTPGPPTGRFFEIHQRRPGLTDWTALHVTLQEAVAAGRVSSAWAESRALQWGRTSAAYLNRVCAEFADSDEDGVVPLAWVEAACERWREWVDAGRLPTDEAAVVGVDVGRGGDKTVLAIRRGDIVEHIERHMEADVMAVTGHVVTKLGEGAVPVVDIIGIGAGVFDRLRELNRPAVAFNASERSLSKDRSGQLGFANRRAEAWWATREALDPANDSTLCLPDDDELIGDLCAPRWRVNSSGRVQIEGKDAIRKRLGRSPDVGDAVVMTVGVPTQSRGRRRRRMTTLSRAENQARAARRAVYPPS